MGTCEPGQGRNPAAISSQPFVRRVSHRQPLAALSARLPGLACYVSVALCDV